MNKIYIITMLCTDTDGMYYNEVLQKIFHDKESVFKCVEECIKEEIESLEDEEMHPTIKEYENGKQVWYDGICLTDYEIWELGE